MPLCDSQLYAIKNLLSNGQSDYRGTLVHFVLAAAVCTLTSFGRIEIDELFLRSIRQLDVLVWFWQFRQIEEGIDNS